MRPDHLLPSHICSQLYERGLAGTITPDGWAQLSSLEYVGVFSQSLSGTLLPAWGLPASLLILDVGGNPSLGGTISADWRLPDSLQASL